MREMISLSLWVLVFVKLLVYDIDVLLVNRVPWLAAIYPYKFFLLTAGLAAFWLVFGGRYVKKIILYVAAYPLILLFWHIPKMLFKNWATLLLFAPAIESMILKVQVEIHCGEFCSACRFRDSGVQQLCHSYS